jgi:2-amino-4-hydroxy-6-hydroxymethyldihydropteridine diphosphokinase
MSAGDASDIVRAYVGMGSNLEDPLRQIESAMAALERLPASRLVACSALYWSEPVGPPGQPRYVNAAACIGTGLSAQGVLHELQAVERQQGRVRGQRWGARTLDLDLLVYGDLVIDTPELTVPHPRLHERAFVLIPLHDIEPGLSIPGVGTVAELCRAIDRGGVRRVSGEGHAG